METMDMKMSLLILGGETKFTGDTEVSDPTSNFSFEYSSTYKLKEKITKLKIHQDMAKVKS